MTDTPDIPIVVNDSAVPAQLGTTVRQAWLLVAGWAIGKGYIDESTATMIGGVLLIVAPIAWGQYQRWTDHREKRALAISAPIGSLK